MSHGLFMMLFVKLNHWYEMIVAERLEVRTSRSLLLKGTNSLDSTYSRS